MVLGDWKAVCRSSTFVDSALPGNQFFASFFSAPVSLPASGPATATRTIQKRSTNHFVRRPTMTRVAALDTLSPCDTNDSDNLLLPQPVRYRHEPRGWNRVDQPPCWFEDG